MTRAMPPPTGTTAVVGVIGDPVEHSLSPVLHNAAFAHLGADWIYVAFPVAPRDVAIAVAGAIALGLRGLSVTMPHKEPAALACDQRSSTVERLGAANTIVVRSGVAIAHSTDGEGLLADLATTHGTGFDPAGRRCVVLGAGGAARAVVLALASAGAASVVVVNRSADRGARAAELAGAVGRLGTLADLGDADLVVKATPLGMMPGDEVGEAQAAGERLGRGQVAVDLVYAPAETPFLRAAAMSGATTRNGLGMLVRQAALQFELWTGERAPLDAMWAAARGVA